MNGRFLCSMATRVVQSDHISTVFDRGDFSHVRATQRLLPPKALQRSLLFP